MKTGAIIGIVFGSIVVVGVGGILIYRTYRRNTSDNMAIEIESVDWPKREVKYKITENGQFSQGGTEFWRQDLVGKGKVGCSISKKNQVCVTHEKDRLIISGVSLGISKFNQVIDFKNKKVFNDLYG